MEVCQWQKAKYINNVRKAFVVLCHYNNYYVLLILTGLKRKIQVLKTYVYCMVKPSIKHLFISCGK